MIDQATRKIGGGDTAVQPLHVIRRGSNRGAIFFFAAEDDRPIPRVVAEAAGRYVCRVHACVLMTNHLHLLATPRDEDSLPRMMQSLGNLVRRPLGGPAASA